MSLYSFNFLSDLFPTKLRRHTQQKQSKTKQNKTKNNQKKDQSWYTTANTKNKINFTGFGNLLNNNKDCSLNNNEIELGIIRLRTDDKM